MSSRLFPFMALMACACAYKLEDPCSLPLDRGNCYSYTQQWHYDASRGQCYEFIYSGCSGNENRFDSLEACESRCKTAPTQSLSITEAARGEKSIPAECRVSVALEECYHASRVWYFDQNRRECVWYSNKDSGSTCRHLGTFKSQETCERTCGTFQGLAVCSVPRDAGPCHNFTAFWFYDLAYGGCSRFWYGGCEGNGNRFATKEDCEDVCVQPAPRDACKIPSVKGPCDGDSLRWYYNISREQCMPFRYGGCLGNDNNFDTRDLCQTQCEPARATDMPAGDA